VRLSQTRWCRPRRPRSPNRCLVAAGGESRTTGVVGPVRDGSVRSSPGLGWFQVHGLAHAFRDPLRWPIVWGCRRRVGVVFEDDAPRIGVWLRLGKVALHNLRCRKGSFRADWFGGSARRRQGLVSGVVSVVVWRGTQRRHGHRPADAKMVPPRCGRGDRWQPSGARAAA